MSLCIFVLLSAMYVYTVQHMFLYIRLPSFVHFYPSVFVADTDSVPLCHFFASVSVSPIVLLSVLAVRLLVLFVPSTIIQSRRRRQRSWSSTRDVTLR